MLIEHDYKFNIISYNVCLQPSIIMISFSKVMDLFQLLHLFQVKINFLEKINWAKILLFGARSLLELNFHLQYVVLTVPKLQRNKKF